MRRGLSCCCTPTTYSRWVGRFRFGSMVVEAEAKAPQLLIWLGNATVLSTGALHAHSLSVRALGLISSAISIPSFSTYSDTLPRIAVLPLPHRSYTAPRRGSTLFQSETGIAEMFRAGTQVPAGLLWAGTDILRWSNRTPKFKVRRFLVQESCAKTPSSALTSCFSTNGVLYSRTAVGTPLSSSSKISPFF